MGTARGLHGYDKYRELLCKKFNRFVPGFGLRSLSNHFGSYCAEARIEQLKSWGGSHRSPECDSKEVLGRSDTSGHTERGTEGSCWHQLSTELVGVWGLLRVPWSPELKERHEEKEASEV